MSDYYKGDLYKELVFRFIDRMSDPAECDPAEKILQEFVVAFVQVVRVESMTQDQDDGGVGATVSKSNGWCAIRHEYNDDGVCNDCGHTIDVSEEIGGLDIGDHCSECGQEWTGTL